VNNCCNDKSAFYFEGMELVVKILIYILLLLLKMILYEVSKQTECSEVKGIKKGINFFTVHIWTGGHIHLPVCLSGLKS
jgi:hypothetical protein